MSGWRSVHRQALITPATSRIALATKSLLIIAEIRPMGQGTVPCLHHTSLSPSLGRCRSETAPTCRPHVSALGAHCPSLSGPARAAPAPVASGHPGGPHHQARGPVWHPTKILWSQCSEAGANPDVAADVLAASTSTCTPIVA